LDSFLPRFTPVATVSPNQSGVDTRLRVGPASLTPSPPYVPQVLFFEYLLLSPSQWKFVIFFLPPPFCESLLTKLNISFSMVFDVSLLPYPCRPEVKPGVVICQNSLIVPVHWRPDPTTSNIPRTRMGLPGYNPLVLRVDTILAVFPVSHSPSEDLQNRFHWLSRSKPTMLPGAFQLPPAKAQLFFFQCPVRAWEIP